jgi:membrane peptidoglycan carboxypeptidase
MPPGGQRNAESSLRPAGRRTLDVVAASRSKPSVVPQLMKALLTSVLAGLVLAALALPVVGGLGLSAKGAADEFLVLPAELETPPLPQRSRILAVDGSLIATLYSENRVVVPLADVPDHVRKAVIAIEDGRFYAHNGVDPKGTLRAALANAQANGVTQGGSTLTQQYVKNALLQAAGTEQEQQAAREVSLERKLREARYALALERKLSKDEILERYLNIAYYGNGVYGIATAASFYFGKPLQELTIGEGALLAGIVQQPGRFDPLTNLPAVVSRRNTVLSRMADVGFITEAQREAEAVTVPALAPTPVGRGCDDLSVTAPFFCDYVRRVLEDDRIGAALGSTREERQTRLLAGGLTIKTTLDPKVQNGAQVALGRQLPPGDPSGVAGVVDVVEPGTGAVRAMAVSEGYGDNENQTKVNLALGGTQGFQGGSTFKPFVLAAALQKGIPLDLTMFAPNRYASKEFTNDGEPYEVGNAGEADSGTYTLETATHASVNTYYLQLLERTGIEDPAAIAESLGLRQFQGGEASAPLDRFPSFTFGTPQISPLDLAAAYAAFAAHGLYCPPQAVTEILDSAGQPIPLPEQSCTQALEPRIADTVTSVLTGVLGPGGTGRRAVIDRPAAGKSGSTNGSTAALFTGYTPQLATTVWVGKPIPSPLQKIRIAGAYYRQVYGGGLPASIWRETMQEALRDVPVEGFADRDETTARGNRAVIPDVKGQTTEQARQTLTEAGFGVRVGDTVSAAPVPRGQVAYTSPRAGREAAPGTTVTLFTSNGRARPAPPPSPEPEPEPEREPEPLLPPEPDDEAEAQGRGNGRGNGNGNGNGG